jgi:hypothetical protein
MKRRLVAAALPVAALLALTGGPATAEAWLKDPITGCEIWTAGDSVPNEGASWSGACERGKASGRGTLIFWDDEGLEARYDGDVWFGKVHGEGKLRFRNDEDGGFDTYTGLFREGEMHGEGVWASSNGYRFEGELIDGMTHGRGILTTPQGWQVKGEIKDGEGIGTLLVFYETEDKELYFGEVENGKRHGSGTLLMPSDDVYVGEFEDGDPSGPGLFDGADGSAFIGMFANGKPNGAGTAIDVAGTIYQGLFIDGKADGKILVTMEDGTQSIETWKNGEKVE